MKKNYNYNYGLKNTATLLDAIYAAKQALNHSKNQEDQACIQAEIEALAKAGDIGLQELNACWDCLALYEENKIRSLCRQNCPHITERKEV